MSLSQRAPLTPEQERILDQASRNEGRCESRLVGPRIDFHFRFSAFLQLFISDKAMGFSERGPEEDRPGRRPVLMVARITSLDSNAPPSFLHQTASIRREAIFRGKLGFGFRFYSGAGEYKIDWMLETASGRICAGRKTFQTKVSRGIRDIRPSLEHGHSYFEGQTGPRPWWYPKRMQDGFRLKLILNIPPFKDRRPLMAVDLSRIEAIMTWLAYHPRVRAISLVVFNLKDQRVIYRQDETQFLPNPEDLSEAIRSLTNNLIVVETLKKAADSEFLSELLVTELSETENFDAVIFLGPRSPLSFDADGTIQAIQDSAPVYYFKYRFRSAGATWADPLQKVTNKLGGKTFAIRDPEDLWRGVEELMTGLGSRR